MRDNSKALILIDLQNDFFPGGALGVAGAEAVIPIANILQDYFSIIIATQDWHPAQHKSFASNQPGKKVYDRIDLQGISQVLWPDHCLQNSQGAELHPQLRRDKITKIITKGTDVNIDSYSGFFDNAHKKDTGLNAYLKSLGIEEVYILGLATDYCVQYSVIDAANLGYTTFLIEDGCFGIEQAPGDIEQSKQNMLRAGALMINSKTLMDNLSR
jgi:nicotinamidase/pyrazinamidase